MIYFILLAHNILTFNTIELLNSIIAPFLLLYEFDYFN